MLMIHQKPFAKTLWEAHATVPQSADICMSLTGLSCLTYTHSVTIFRIVSVNIQIADMFTLQCLRSKHFTGQVCCRRTLSLIISKVSSHAMNVFHLLGKQSLVKPIFNITIFNFKNFNILWIAFCFCLQSLNLHLNLFIKGAFHTYIFQPKKSESWI